MSHPTAELLTLASTQYGVVALHQARRLAPRNVLRHEFGSDRWIREFRAVYRAAGSPRTPESDAMAHLLRSGPGAVLSHYSTLALFEVSGLALDPLHVTRMRGSNGIKLRDEPIIAHESRRLPPHHITTHLGFATVTPSRALADVCRTENVGRIERWLDWLWSRRLASRSSVQEVVLDLHKRGRPELSKLAGLLSERGHDYVAPASGLESRFNSILDKADLPGVKRQVNLGGVEWLARVDFKIDGFPLIVEVQSETYHASLTAERDDVARFKALADAGFTSVQVWEREVWHRPDEAIGSIQAAIAELRS